MHAGGDQEKLYRIVARAGSRSRLGRDQIVIFKLPDRRTWTIATEYHQDTFGTWLPGDLVLTLEERGRDATQAIDAALTNAELIASVEDGATDVEGAPGQGRQVPSGAD